MPSATALPAADYRGDHLTRKLLRRSGLSVSEDMYHLLEQLTIDSVYTLKDDFDKGINEYLWVQDGPAVPVDEVSTNGAEGAREALSNEQEPVIDPHGGAGRVPEVPPDNSQDARGGRGFVWLPERNGVIVGTGDTRRLALMSRTAIWTADSRCGLMGRMSFTALPNTRFEFGFIDEDASHIKQVDRVVQVKDTPAAALQRRDFAVINRDTVDDTSTDLVARSNGGTAALTAASGPPTLTAVTWATFAVALNEQNEARFWINGVYAGVNRSSARRDVPLSIWFAVAGVTDVKIDYIQAWQERNRLPRPGEIVT